MGCFWLIGMIVVAAYRAYASGKVDFTYSADYRWRKTGDISGDKVFNYIIITFGIAFFWPIVLPSYGLYKLGQKRK